MRIISGILKGRKIEQPNDNLTRPLKDLTKESIFNLISHSKKFNFKMEGSRILDVFSGTGSFGLECMSRGASNVIFVENHLPILSVLKRNIKNFNFEKKSQIINADLFSQNIYKIINSKCNLIFFDPPYKERRIYNLLKQIELAKIIEKGALIIFHRHKKDLDLVPESFKKIEERTYGISKIIFYILF